MQSAAAPKRMQHAVPLFITIISVISFVIVTVVTMFMITVIIVVTTITCVVAIVLVIIVVIDCGHYHQYPELTTQFSVQGHACHHGWQKGHQMGDA